MRILINAAAAKSGGAVTTLSNLVCTLPTLDQRNTYLIYVPPGRTRLPREAVDRIRIIQANTHGHSPWRRFFSDQITLRQILQRQKIDLLVSSSDFGMFFPPCKQVLMLRNSLFFSRLYLKRILPHKSWAYRMDFLLRRFLIRLSIKFSDVVLTTSQSMLADVRRLTPIPDYKAAVNPFGTPLSTFSYERPRWESQKGAFRLLYVSEYGDYKNLATLLKALLLLKEQGIQDFTLTTTADPSQFPGVEISTRKGDAALFSDPRLAPHVRKTGSVPYEGVEKLYWESDVFVFPSVAESFGHPLVEAMASGLPVIASDIPICREICGEAALYFNPWEPGELSEKILLLSQNPALRQRLAEAGRARAELHFNWVDHVKRLIELFERTGDKGDANAKGRDTFRTDWERNYYSRNWPKQAQSYRHLEPYIRTWMKPEDLFDGKRILDMGAGECTYTRLIAERFTPREVVACELFPERMLPAARVNRNSLLRFVAGDCHHLPLRDGSVDVVFGSFILHQLPDLAEVVWEIRRVLSWQGCYVGIEPNPTHPVHLYRYLRGKHSPNQYLLSPRHLAVFRDAGFEITIRYFYAKLPWARNRLLGTCIGIVAERKDG